VLTDTFSQTQNQILVLHSECQRDFVLERHNRILFATHTSSTKQFKCECAMNAILAKDSNAVLCAEAKVLWIGSNKFNQHRSALRMKTSSKTG
jgi:hypothetical protein